jgi:O-antigen biosynthesis protein
VIIPTYNGAYLVDNCLKEIVKTVSGHLEVEFLVMDDASTDKTPQMAEEWLALDSRIRFHRNPQNLGFLRSSNRGAELANGEVIIFLNNDTLPQPGWLTPLLRTLKDHPEAGAVGGKLMYPNGLLQEAGGIIFSDGEGWNFGRFDYKINAPIYNYLREVDYCSGALLATWRDLFLEDGGFDELFVPMYYEDVDYCFSLRAKGKKVYYQPDSVIIHLEGGTAGTDISKGFKTYQKINYIKFIEKWSTDLKRQPAHPDGVDMPTKLDLVVRSEKELAKAEIITPFEGETIAGKDDR